MEMRVYDFRTSQDGYDTFKIKDSKKIFNPDAPDDQRKMKKSSQLKWRIKDLIDVDYFLHQTLNTEDATPSRNQAQPDRSTDRDIYLAYEKQHTPPPFERENLIRFWLDEKRGAAKKMPDAPFYLPGDIYTETVRLGRTILGVLALVIGAAMSWSVLSYSGTAPINIFTCVWILVVPQLLLIAFLGSSMAISRFRSRVRFRSGPYAFIMYLVAGLYERALSFGNRRLRKTHRIKTSAAVGTLRRVHHRYGPIFFWPVFVLAQVFGVFYNLGLVGSILLKLAITDLAFGWQSTLHPSPETVHRLVEIISLPWSWAASPHPTLEQIAGSQMILKDGIFHLSTPNLVSWWPFLCFAVCFYGLLPRLILLAAGIVCQNIAAKRVSFSTADGDQLLRRMRTPRVRTAGEKQTPPPDQTRRRDPQPAPDRPSRPRPATADLIPAIMAIPEDIDPVWDENDLADRMARATGLAIIRRIVISMDPADDAKKLAAALSAGNTASGEHRIVILTEAWQPPIRETMDWLKHLITTLPEQTGLIVALVGKPDGRAVFTAPADTDRRVWEQAVAALGSSFVRVENLGGGQ